MGKPHLNVTTQLGADLHVINAQNAHLRLFLADCSRHCATSFTDGCFRFLWSDKCHKTCPKLINLRLTVFRFFLFASVRLTASNYRFDINEWDCMCVVTKPFLTWFACNRISLSPTKCLFIVANCIRRTQFSYRCCVSLFSPSLLEYVNTLTESVSSFSGGSMLSEYRMQMFFVPCQTLYVKQKKVGKSIFSSLRQFI